MVGFDPGIARLGYGVVDPGEPPTLVEFGVVETTSKDSTPERLRLLYEASTELLREFRPSVVAVEQLFFARNVTTAITVGQARGVLLLAAAQHSLPVQDFSPTEIKLAVTGYGNADKQQVQEMVKLILELDDIPQPDDAADAIAAAICCAHNMSVYGAST